MKIQVNTDNSVEGNDAHTLTVETAVRSGLDRYGDRLTRVEAYLSSDDNAADKGQMGIKCLLEARPASMDPVVVTGTGDTIERACHDATHKMQSLLDSTFGRIDSQDGNATIRQNRS